MRDVGAYRSEHGTGCVRSTTVVQQDNNNYAHVRGKIIPFYFKVRLIISNTWFPNNPDILKSITSE